MCNDYAELNPHMSSENGNKPNELQDLTEIGARASQQAQTALEALAGIPHGLPPIDLIEKHLSAQILKIIAQLAPVIPIIKAKLNSSEPDLSNYLDYSEEAIREGIRLDNQRTSDMAIDFYKLQARNYHDQYLEALKHGDLVSADRNFRFFHACDKSATAIELHSQTLAV